MFINANKVVHLALSSDRMAWHDLKVSLARVSLNVSAGLVA